MSFSYAFWLTAAGGRCGVDAMKFIALAVVSVFVLWLFVIAIGPGGVLSIPL
jgi:hypothetical protein